MEAPYQHLGRMLRDMCTRNRTNDAEGGREETKDLDGIDKVATEQINKQIDAKQRSSLDITRTGATSTRAAAFWPAQAEEKTCQISKEGQEKADHLWFCKALHGKRKEIDNHLAEPNPNDLPNPIRHGNSTCDES